MNISNYIKYRRHLSFGIQWNNDKKTGGRLWRWNENIKSLFSFNGWAHLFSNFISRKIFLKFSSICPSQFIYRSIISHSTESSLSENLNSTLVYSNIGLLTNNSFSSSSPTSPPYNIINYNSYHFSSVGILFYTEPIMSHVIIKCHERLRSLCSSNQGLWNTLLNCMHSLSYS